MEALREAEAKLTVYVHPSNAADVSRAVARQLSALLFSCVRARLSLSLPHISMKSTLMALLAQETKVVDDEDKKKETIVEDNKKETIVEDKMKAKILNGLVSYFGVQVHANLLLFSLQPDMTLHCKSTSKGRLKCSGRSQFMPLYWGFFSVAIMSEDICEKFKFRRGGYRMNCHITGSLISPHTGSMHTHAFMILLKIYLNPFSLFKLCDNKCAVQIFSIQRRSRDISTKIEQNEQEHRILKNEESMAKSERPHKSRRRSIGD
ncbi:hypothetical protein BAE44_0013878 [Dichanthelium oligosanthes]|uniref:Uncharacterized protein n=1 Tax=Dichanthelium oligosanthes TaxID=888268 RepID=A0A1E5VJ41_9POAL|nr:hypothetical protein BAE44_0013878 [Dichanthelium oligosanthes]